MSIFNALSYLAEIYAEADDATPAASVDAARDLVGVRAVDASRDVTVLLADRERAYVIIVGPQPGESILVFGEGSDGARPADASDGVSSTYATGAGGSGNLSISGLGLARPILVMVVANSGLTRFAYVPLDSNAELASDACAGPAAPAEGRG